MRSITLLSALTALILTMGMAKSPPEKKKHMEDPASLLVTERSDGPSFWRGGNSSPGEETVLIDSDEAW